LGRNLVVRYSSQRCASLQRRERGTSSNHFECLQVRVYGDVGIVNGLVVTTNKDGNTVDKTVFIDVFVYRDGRWQAVNTQENAVRMVDKPY
jgi:uncharacterized protein DUF4440